MIANLIITYRIPPKMTSIDSNGPVNQFTRPFESIQWFWGISFLLPKEAIKQNVCSLLFHHHLLGGSVTHTDDVQALLGSRDAAAVLRVV